MNKLSMAILITATALGSASCKKETIGEGPVTTETRNVQNFSGIDLRMNGNVYYTVGTVRKVEVSAPQTLHSMIETSIADNRLVIRYKNGRTYDADDRIRINVTAPALSSFFLNTSGSIYVMNELNAGELMLRSWGSGSIFLQNVIADNIDAETTVSGRITATSGTAISEKLKSKASGKIDLAGVAAKTVITHSSGSGDMRVRASENLDVTINGSGSVYFSGYPYISSHISGTGKLIRF